MLTGLSLAGNSLYFVLDFKNLFFFFFFFLFFVFFKSRRMLYFNF